MKVVLLAGGFGTRISEETSARPKPMVEIGGRPILVHIMDLFAAHGFKDFYVACGYKSDYIKRYFADFHYHNADLHISLKDGARSFENISSPDWDVHCIDTGLETMTGGRLLHMADHLSDGAFMCTYGDGLSDVALGELLAFHRAHGKLATVTAVHPPARFGALELDGDMVTRFSEKPRTGRDWINGGFFVFEPGILDYIEASDSSLEADVLEKVAAEGQLAAFHHDGFFQPMDTLREKQLLEQLWKSGEAPWAARVGRT
ncbi:MAG TPA: glucose-1-phosphate cytidylyltransferase [Aliiroseovarius sp.]|nr:glucose-1-phosphate cytidylyltransferase [Aliiroseovarius sp.]